MMLFWILASCLALVCTLWMASPFLQRRSIEMDDAEGTISVFRDQQAEVDRDLEEGMISQEEHGAAKREIQIRALKAARSMSTGLSVSHRSAPIAALIVLLCSVLTLGGYSMLGNPQSKDRPLAARQMEVLQQRADAGDINSQITLLINRTSENPESFEDWWTLGASYATIGDYASAVDAFRHAVELGGDRPGVMAAYGEAMVLANGNKVPTAARVIFEQVLQDGPDPRARYYVALAKAQSQDFEAALADWSALARDSDATAPWMPLVRRDITNMARFLKVDVSDHLPDATASEIAQAGGADKENILLARASEMEAALAKDPMDYKGWISLAEIRAQNGDSLGAKSAIEEARGHFAAAPFVLQKLDETAIALGLDILQNAPGTRGPTNEDIAAAADMTDADRNAMVEGMVAGLAAKLEENPDNPEGWIMLIRSYAVLGKVTKAQSSYETATEYFEGSDKVLARLKNEAGAMIMKQ